VIESEITATKLAARQHRDIGFTSAPLYLLRQSGE
jgi:hypothetical protein